MSAEEYGYWQAYFSVEPFPEQQADLRNAVLLQAIMAQATQGKKVPKIEELLPDWWGNHAPDSPALIQSKMRMVATTIKAQTEKKRAT